MRQLTEVFIYLFYSSSKYYSRVFLLIIRIEKLQNRSSNKNLLKIIFYETISENNKVIF